MVEDFRSRPDDADISKVDNVAVSEIEIGRSDCKTFQDTIRFQPIDKSLEPRALLTEPREANAMLPLPLPYDEIRGTLVSGSQYPTAGESRSGSTARGIIAQPKGKSNSAVDATSGTSGPRKRRQGTERDPSSSGSEYRPGDRHGRTPLQVLFIRKQIYVKLLSLRTSC